jgi:hypothetical protein
MRQLLRMLVILMTGWLVVWCFPHLIALIFTIPGLRILIDGIRTAGFSPQYVFPLLTNYLPVFLLAFLVSLPVFKFVRGNRVWLFLVALLPWAGYSIETYLLFCWNTEMTCFGASPFHELLGAFCVPLGFALAAWVSRDRKPPSSNKAIETDAAQVRVKKASRVQAAQSGSS